MSLLSRYKQQSSGEKRKYPRVDDNIILIWRQLEPNERADDLANEENPLFFYPIESQINLIGADTSYLLKPIKEKSPILAAYLENLERKIDIIARAIGTADEVGKYALQPVNISACGLAFLSENECPINASLELKIILPSTLHSIMVYGNVVDSSLNDDMRTYTVGVNFTHIKEYDRDHLMWHVARRKAMQDLMKSPSF
jgi:hypothetical protein